MASASPALHSTRPTGMIDLRKPGEYPIVLGKSLRRSDNADQLLNLRYNWQPKYGFGISSTNISSTKDGYRLTVKEAEDTQYSAFKYTGHDRPAFADASEPASSLALVYDKAESVFKLELIAKSLDLNLESTSSQTIDVRRHPKLPGTAAKTSKSQTNGETRPPGDDETPDPTNPFDFRNFLEEAKEKAEKPTQAAGGRTPIPGNRTPMSGFASPATGAARFKATTPQFHANSSPVPKKRKTEDQKTQGSASSLRKPIQRRRKPVEEKKVALSKDRISDSDDELSDTITVETTAPPKQAQQKGHSRNFSGSFGRSPHIVVNDGDLEIDMGSPPPEARGRPRSRINPDAFRSHTGTPVMGRSSNRHQSSDDVQMMDMEEDHSEDGDVEEFDLGSPRTSRLSVHESRSASIIEPASSSVEHAPTPPNQAGDDDDDLLAAELEAALEEDDKDADPGAYGLGITGAAPRIDEDEESEVSEEE